MSNYLNNLKWFFNYANTIEFKSESESGSEMEYESESASESEYESESESESESTSDPDNEYDKIVENYIESKNTQIDSEQLIMDQQDEDILKKIKDNYSEYLNNDIHFIKDFETEIWEYKIKSNIIILDEKIKKLENKVDNLISTLISERIMFYYCTNIMIGICIGRIGFILMKKN